MTRSLSSLVRTATCALPLALLCACTSPTANSALPLAKAGAKPTTRLTLLAKSTPSAGKPVPIEAKITRIADRTLILKEQMMPEAGALTLIAIDSNYNDLKLITPEETTTRGLYRFTLTPASAQSYRVWADLALADKKIREFPFADVGGKSGVNFPRQESMSATLNGNTYILSLAEPLAKGRAVVLTLKRGEQVLPIREAVGFYDDYRTIFHESPAGQELTITPVQDGFARLFIRTSDQNAELVVPFTLSIAKK